MTDAETKTGSAQPQAVRRSRWEVWTDPILADWRERWPAAFTKPVPLAVGFSGQMKAALRAEGKAIDRKLFGIAIRRWTMHGAYLRAVARGEMRRNLDGTEAGVPDDAARQDAQKLLNERAARRVERERKEQERRDTMATTSMPPS